MEGRDELLGPYFLAKMKPVTGLNLFLLLVVIGEYAWFRHLTRQESATFDFASLHVVGYRFDVVDAKTGKATSTLVNVRPKKGGPGFSSISEATNEYVHLSGRWIGHLPDLVEISASGYQPKSVEIGDYPEAFQKVLLTPR